MSNYNSQLQSNNTDLQELLEVLQTKAAGGEQATPEISVSSNGLITATAGDKSATHQLTTQAAKTITPSTSSQTAVASGRYTTGNVTVAAIPSSYVEPTSTKGATTYTPSTTNQTIAAGTYCSGVQTIKGDSNLVADNIKSGINIFNVTGTYEGGGGGGSVETCNITLTKAGGILSKVYYASKIDGVITACTEVVSGMSTGTILQDVVCGSVLVIRDNDTTMVLPRSIVTSDNITLEYLNAPITTHMYQAIFSISSGSQSNASIEII